MINFRLLRSAVLLVPAILPALLSGCSDPAPPASIAAPIANVAPAMPGTAAPPVPAPPQLPARGYFLLDFVSGQVLAAQHQDERLEPASLTKLMTAYAVFHALKDSRIKLEDMVRVSAHARSQEGSRMFIDVGTSVSVENLIQGMIVQSGNDATVALAEHVGGSEPVFVDLMNQYAQQLGMAGTRFQNSAGMPHAEHYSTARDIGVLSAALIREYPQYYKWYSQREFTWNKITQPNRNGLLARDPSVDGIKTGHTESAGYCLVSSAKRDDMRLIAVVMGAPKIQAREDASAALLNYGFNFFQTRKLYTANQPVMAVRVWKGEAEQIEVGVPHDVYATIPRGQEASLAAAADIIEPVFAPLNRGTSVGTLRLTLGDQTLGTYPLHPVQDVSQAGFVSRLIDDAKLWIQ